jgi:hypothetical protein
MALENFNSHTNEVLKKVIEQNIDEIKNEEIIRIDDIFGEKEFIEKTKKVPTLKMNIKNNIEKYLNDYKSLLNKEISTILERNFRSIEFKDKNFITKIIMNKKISKQVENEKIEKEKELYQTIKQQSQTLIEELKTKLKLKFIGEDRKIRNEIEKLDGLLKLNDDLKRLIGEIQDIESIIK